MFREEKEKSMTRRLLKRVFPFRSMGNTHPLIVADISKARKIVDKSKCIDKDDPLRKKKLEEYKKLNNWTQTNWWWHP